jgi:Asp-tRNA(Asn)/Glu-tRNA(Gln) amidotransferase A subunit family amidase
VSHVVTRSVRDSAALLDATAGPEPGNPYDAPHQAGTFLAQLERDPGTLRIAVGREKWGPGHYQPEAIAGIDATVKLLESLGHEVEEARPDYDDQALSLALATITSTSTALACSLRAEQLGCPVNELEMEETTRAMLEIAAGVTGEAYATAIRANQLAGFALGRFHQHYDIILTPTMSREPVAIGYLSGAPLDELLDRLNNFMGETALFNQTGQPSISLPLYWTENQLPLGMMFSASFGNEALLLQLASQLEQAQPWWDKRPPVHSG